MHYFLNIRNDYKECDYKYIGKNIGATKITEHSPLYRTNQKSFNMGRATNGARIEVA